MDPSKSPSRKIVVVTEDLLYAELLQYGLSSRNFHTTITMNGPEAQGVITREKPDAVVLNVFMAVNDAFKLLHWLEQSELDIPVLALTSSEARALTVEAVVAGARDILVKPVTIGSILQSLEAFWTTDRGVVTQPTEESTR